MFGFLNPYLFWIKLGGAVLAAAVLFGAGMAVEAKFKNATIAGMQRDTARAETIAQAKGRALQAQIDRDMADGAYAAGVATGKAQAKTITLTKEIPIYVTVETDRAFAVPCGLYRVLHAAADSTDPATVDLPPGLTDGSACPIAVSDIADTGVAWAGLYHKAEAQIAGLQALARTLAAGAEQ